MIVRCLRLAMVTIALLITLMGVHGIVKRCRIVMLRGVASVIVFLVF